MMIDLRAFALVFSDGFSSIFGAICFLLSGNPCSDLSPSVALIFGREAIPA
jgi:hypothetical protein